MQPAVFGSKGLSTDVKQRAAEADVQAHDVWARRNIRLRDTSWLALFLILASPATCFQCYHRTKIYQQFK
jgi:hypothetical protein